MREAQLVEISLLGRVSAKVAGEQIDLRGRSQLTVLALLALSPGRAVSVGRLYDALWGENLPANPASNLQTYVSRLRGAIGAELVQRVGTGYRLDAANVVVDTDLVDQLVSDDAVEQALQLWRGPVLDGVNETDELFAERTRLELLRDLLSERLLLEQSRHTGQTTEVLPQLRVAFDSAPEREPVALELAEVLWRDRQPAEALRTLEAHRSHMREMSGLEPSAEVALLEQRILNDDQTRHVARQVDATRRLRRAPAFLGRRDEIALLDEMVNDGGLVTVTGPGGVGKTSLVAEWASLHDNVIVVELDRIGNDDQLISAVIDALGLGAVEISVPVIVASLAEAQSVLVLDNCEHVLAGARRLVEELETALAPTVIATSRQMLGAAHERVLPVRTLDFEAPDGGAAAELFIQRSQRINPGLVLDRDNVEDIVTICRRLDGLPLAIELAASRTGAFSVREIAEHLDDALDALVDSAAPRRRQQTLRAAVDWSYQLLPEPAQQLLPALSVFSGGFTPAAAESVGATPAALGALIDANLVVQQHSTARKRRYRLLEATRQFAGELLTDPSHAREGRNAWIDQLVSAAEQDCGTAAEVQAITDLQRDINNIELALIDGLAANPSRAAKIGVVLGRYGPYYGTASLFALIDRIAESDRLSQAARGPGAIAAAAHNSWMRGKYEQAHTLATRALEHLDANSPDRYMANFTLAGILYWQGEFEESLPYLQEIDNNHASSTMARAGACAEMALRLAILGDETNAATQIERGTSLAVSSGSPTALAHAKAVSAGMNLMADPSYAIAQASASAELAQSCGARAVELMAHTAQISAQNIMGQHDEVLAALPRVLPDLRRHGGWSYLWIFLRAAGDSLAQLNHTDAAAYAILAATADAAAPPRGLYAELLHITKDDIRAQLNNPELWDRYAIEIAAESRSQRVDRMIGLVRAIRV